MDYKKNSFKLGRPIKTIIAAALLMAAGLSATAQPRFYRGVSIGADRDTLLWIIASPFDNWWVNVSPGVQTFIGNEQDNEARWNRIVPSLRAEVGKWILPDLAVSLRWTGSHIYSQGSYGGLNPWLDRSDQTGVQFDGSPYFSQSMNGFVALGLVTLDWTNLFCGYETGRRSSFHIYTPIGMGGMWLWGKTNNSLVRQRDELEGRDPDRTRWNKELAFSAGLGLEYYPKKSDISFFVSGDLTGIRGTVDWTYSSDLPDAPHPKRKTDWLPSFNMGVTINIIHHIHKRNLATGMRFRDTVYHEFRTVGTYRGINRLRESVKILHDSVDGLNDKANSLVGDTSRLGQRLRDLEGSIQNIEDQLDTSHPAYHNGIQALKDYIETNDLPATVVYYELDKFNLDATAHRRLRRFASKMNRLNDTIEFLVIGAADSLTGSRRHNDWLSDRRCKAAFDALTKTYGADPNRLIMRPMGGITAYEPKEDNRMAMIVLRTPAVEALIEKWSRYKK